MPRKSLFKDDPLDSLIDLYEQIPEPRVKGRCKHKLVDVLVIITCAYLCGVADWEEIELFANEKIKWFKKYLELPSGIPSHDTFLRVFKLIDPKAFELIFLNWIQSVIDLKKDQVIAFDGKKVSGTNPKSLKDKERALCLLNIWAVDNNLTLGQLRVKSTGFSESLGIKECLDYLNLEGMIVTADSASAFTGVAEKIRSKKADYLLPIKRSNKSQAQALEEILQKKVKKSKAIKKEKIRGREEIRACEVISDKKVIDEFSSVYKWPDLKVIGVMNYYRKEKEKRVVKQVPSQDGGWKWIKVDGEYRELSEQKFYLSSRILTAEELMEKARSHWHLENKLNWHLDVTFLEDANRTRDKNAAENMSMVRKICLNLLKGETTFNKSLKLKKRKCHMNEAYLEKVLFKV